MGNNLSIITQPVSGLRFEFRLIRPQVLCFQFRTLQASISNNPMKKNGMAGEPYFLYVAFLPRSLETSTYVKGRGKAGVCVSEGVTRGEHLKTHRNLGKKKKSMDIHTHIQREQKAEGLMANVIDKFKIMVPDSLGECKVLSSLITPDKHLGTKTTH